MTDTRIPASSVPPIGVEFVVCSVEQCTDAHVLQNLPQRRLINQLLQKGKRIEILRCRIAEKADAPPSLRLYVEEGQAVSNMTFVINEWNMPDKAPPAYVMKVRQQGGRLPWRMEGALSRPTPERPEGEEMPDGTGIRILAAG